MATYGEKAVGMTFNPSGSGDVDTLKSFYAQIIDYLDAMRSGRNGVEPTSEQKRLYSIAITEAQGACMWAVKVEMERQRRELAKR